MRFFVHQGRTLLMTAVLMTVAGTAVAQTQTEKPKIALYIANDKLKPEEKKHSDAQVPKPVHGKRAVQRHRPKRHIHPKGDIGEDKTTRRLGQ